MGTHGLEQWKRRFAVHRNILERRRLSGRQQARQAAADLRKRWPQIRQIWLHGSLLTPGFHEDSDLDLLVEGLPAEAMITAMAVAERSGPLMPDLKRSEDLDPDLRRRLLRKARPLLPVPDPIDAEDGT